LQIFIFTTIGLPLFLSFEYNATVMNEFAAVPPESQILCHQCAAVLPIEQGSQFVTCEFCGATNFVDKSGAVLHYAVRATVDETAASAALRRWMGGNATVKDLDKKATIERPSFQMFPMWLMRVHLSGQEKVVLEPAAALSILEITELSIPASDLEPYDQTMDGDAILPTVPIETVRKWLAENQKIAAGQIKESSLVHLPLFIFKYSFEGRSYTAVVDAASSQVFASIYPSKREVPYMAIGSVGCLLYFGAALIPLISFFTTDGGGLIWGILIYSVVAILLAIPIFGIAAYVSARV
jgi:LSD1 subclass zinc finger protein